MSTDAIILLGDLATWLTAIGTLGAFSIGFHQIRNERHERKQRQIRETDREDKAQAAKVSAWIEQGKIILSNSSFHAVHNVNITLEDGDIIQRHTLAPGKVTLPYARPLDTDHIADFVFTDTLSHTTWRRIPGTPLRKV